MTDSSLRALAVVLLVLPPLTAAADEKSEAEAAMTQANDFLQRREYDSAVTRFRDALRYVPTASGPYLGLGLAYAATDRCDKAVDALEEYLRRRKKDPKPEARAELDACRVRLNVQPRLRVDTLPPGAEVRLDDMAGAPLGVTPFERTGLPPGEHKVYLSRPGYKAYVAVVRVEPGVLATASVPLEPLEVIAVPLPKPADDGLMTPPSLSGPAPVPPTESPPSTGAPPAIAPAPPGAGAPAVREAQLRLAASAQQASIYVNGERVSRDGRADLQLQPGLYGITVERDGWLGAAGSVTLQGGERRSYTAELRQLKTHGWMSVGALFTVLALAAEGAAIAGHVLADRQVAGTSDYQKFHQLELYGQVGAGSAAGIAVLGFVIDYVINRGRVDEGVPFPLVPAGERH
jgi:hypothetical protein